MRRNRRKHRRRKHGLAASVAAATPAAPTPVQAELQERVEPRHYHATYAEGRLWDRDGRPWQRVDEFVQPQRALQLVRAGARWLVEWCGGPLEWPTEQTAGRLLDQLRGKLVGEAKARRLFRRRTHPTVVIAEEWQDQQGRSLVVFIEGGPAAQDESWFW